MCAWGEGRGGDKPTKYSWILKMRHAARRTERKKSLIQRNISQSELLILEIANEKFTK